MNNKPATILTVALLAAAANSLGQAKQAPRDASDSFSGFSVALGGSQVTQSGRTILEELFQEITVNSNDSTTGGTPPGGVDLPDTYDIREESAAHGFYSKDAFNGQVSLAYNLAVGSNWLIGIEVAKQFGAPTSISSFAYIPGSGNDLDDRVETRNNWSVALKPGYAVSDKFMVYAKFSYANAKVKGGTTLQLASIEGVPVDDISFDESVSGLGLGLGFEYNLDQNWFLQLEIERIGFGSFTKSRTSGTFNETLTNGAPVTDSGAQAGEAYSGTADIGVNLSKATLSLGYRF